MSLFKRLNGNASAEATEAPVAKPPVAVGPGPRDGHAVREPLPGFPPTDASVAATPPRERQPWYPLPLRACPAPNAKHTAT